MWVLGHNISAATVALGIVNAAKTNAVAVTTAKSAAGKDTIAAAKKTCSVAYKSCVGVY